MPADPLAYDPTLVESFCRRWGVRELALFGSVLRKDFRPESDVDVLVSFAEDSDWDYWNWPDMLDELRGVFGRDIDLVVKESLSNPFRRRRILHESRVIHAA
ncbi:MAG: nucleotidyltransferase domain-containing protein [Planctomycetota bacterium]